MLTALAPANSHRTAVPDRSKRLKKKIAITKQFHNFFTINDENLPISKHSDAE